MSSSSTQPQSPPPPPQPITAHDSAPQPSTPSLTSRLTTLLPPSTVSTIETVLAHPGVTPYPALLTSGLCFTSAFAALRGGRGWAGYTPLLGFGAIFLGASHVLTRDVDNGASTATAWGVIYTSLFLRSSLSSRRVAPIGLLAVVMATTGIYGVETYDSYFG
ncbi:hypothetical protein DFJ77DRAFT_27750 [Powellomyces hirtus]|nr:hypothetical protein DFJ77DRAFT_27750 [Powellomyces hirtus]